MKRNLGRSSHGSGATQKGCREVSSRDGGVPSGLAMTPRLVFTPLSPPRRRDQHSRQRRGKKKRAGRGGSCRSSPRGSSRRGAGLPRVLISLQRKRARKRFLCRKLRRHDTRMWRRWMEAAGGGWREKAAVLTGRSAISWPGATAQGGAGRSTSHLCPPRVFQGLGK